MESAAFFEKSLCLLSDSYARLAMLTDLSCKKLGIDAIQLILYFNAF